jgi:hypothetical protein
MCQLCFSFDDCANADNFEIAQDIDGGNICSILNAFVRFLHALGYADDIITDMIGATHFDEEMFDDLDAATSEIIDEYIASRDASDKRLDDLTEFPEN